MYTNNSIKCKKKLKQTYQRDKKVLLICSIHIKLVTDNKTINIDNIIYTLL